MYTRQVENLKRRLGQKRVSRWIENLKGRSRKKLGIKSVQLCSVGSPHRQTSISSVNIILPQGDPRGKWTPTYEESFVVKNIFWWSNDLNHYER